MGSGDIEVVVKASTLKHINTDIIENTDKTKHAIETKIQCVLVFAVALSLSEGINMSCSTTRTNFN